MDQTLTYIIIAVVMGVWLVRLYLRIRAARGERSAQAPMDEIEAVDPLSLSGEGAEGEAKTAASVRAAEEDTAKESGERER